MEKGEINISEYYEWIDKIKAKIHSTRTKIALSANSELLNLYWEIGKEIVKKQNKSDWGSKIIEKMSVDLKHEFPEIKGFSKRNIYAMRQWYLLYSQKFEILPQVVAQIPWGQNRLIISKTKDVNEALFYAQETLKNSWSRDLLEIQIEDKLYQRQGKAITNFDNTLPEIQSDTAKNILKDPYNFDFLGLENDALEKAIEDELTKHITEFLLELGKGFAFIGRQQRITLNNRHYKVDLVFYHTKLKCYVLIDLKIGEVEYEHIGQMKLYLGYYEKEVNDENDNQPIGIILSEEKDDIMVEYAMLNDTSKLLVSKYQLYLPNKEELIKKVKEIINE